MKEGDNFVRLLDLIETLLSENGCPWDKIQTTQSMRQYLIEESYEVAEAIDKNDISGICEELGDVVYLIAFHGKIKEKEGKFDINDILNGIIDKMVFRHPHIFSDIEVKDSDDVVKNWTDLKKEEKKYKSKIDILKSVPISLPSLMRAQKVIHRYWDTKEKEANIQNLLTKIKSQISTIEGQIEDSDCINSEEIGDLFFNIITISDKYKINTELSLTNAIETFINKLEHSDKYN